MIITLGFQKPFSVRILSEELAYNKVSQYFYCIQWCSQACFFFLGVAPFLCMIRHVLGIKDKRGRSNLINVYFVVC